MLPQMFIHYWWSCVSCCLFCDGSKLYVVAGLACCLVLRRYRHDHTSRGYDTNSGSPSATSRSWQDTWSDESISFLGVSNWAITILQDLFTFGATMPWLVLMVTQAVIVFLFAVLPRKNTALASSQDIPVPDALTRLPTMLPQSVSLDDPKLKRGSTMPAYSSSEASTNLPEIMDIERQNTV